MQPDRGAYIRIKTHRCPYCGFHLAKLTKGTQNPGWKEWMENLGRRAFNMHETDLHSPEKIRKLRHVSAKEA